MTDARAPPPTRPAVLVLGRAGALRSMIGGQSVARVLA